MNEDSPNNAKHEDILEITNNEIKIQAKKTKPAQLSIKDILEKQVKKQREEQAKRIRLEKGEAQRTALIMKIQPWRWLELEARSLLRDLSGNTVEKAGERKLE